MQGPTGGRSFTGGQDDASVGERVRAERGAGIKPGEYTHAARWEFVMAAIIGAYPEVESGGVPGLLYGVLSREERWRGENPVPLMVAASQVDLNS